VPSDDENCSTGVGEIVDVRIAPTPNRKLQPATGSHVGQSFTRTVTLTVDVGARGLFVERILISGGMGA